MDTHRINFHINFDELIAIQNLLNTLPAARIDQLSNQFFRVQDFTQSHAGLNHQFASEYLVASIEFKKSKSTEELMSNVSSGLYKHEAGHVYSLGSDNFTTDKLSSSLRHFLNDSCRLLEPFTALLSIKYAGVKVKNRTSFKSFMDCLPSQTNIEFDAAYLSELYELWNDYKHRNTKGLHVTPWTYSSNKVIKPNISLPNKNFVALKNIQIDEFVEFTTRKIREFIQTMITDAS